MKKNSLLALALLVPVFLCCQMPFLPLGARWGDLVQCSPTSYPCTNWYPFNYNVEVTEDTIIQGKYCTVIPENDWGLDGAFYYENFIVHQDGQQIYRYDRVADDFKLVLDFSKEVGESWQIQVPEFWGDTFTITVTQKDGAYRTVSVNGTFGSLLDLQIHEAFGGLADNTRMLISGRFFIHAEPYIWDELTCYIDPVQGLLYGDELGCELTHTTNSESEKDEFILYPNPASNHVVLDYNFPLSQAAEWSLSDALGQTVKKQPLRPGHASNSMLIDNLASGIYFWKILSEGKIIGTGKIIVNR